MSFSWLQKLIRQKTRPIPYKKANRWRNRLSLAYIFIAWNTLGYVAYLHFNGRLKKEYYGHEPDEFDMLSPAQRFALNANIQNAKIASSVDFKVQDFNLEDYKHLQVDQNKERQKIDEHDEDNVA